MYTGPESNVHKTFNLRAIYVLCPGGHYPAKGEPTWNFTQQINVIFFNCYLAAPRQTLSHYKGAVSLPRC